MKEFVIVIPVRFDSKRFPGKPLKKILGKEMIIRTVEQCKKSKFLKCVYVATDSKIIFNLLKKKNFENVIMTPKKCITGTDRIAYFAKKIKAKTYINVQGDEPIIKPNDIDKIYKYAKKNRNEVINGYAKIKNYSELKNPNIPKVVFDDKKNLIYISRSLIPFVKNFNSHDYYKQICVYAFPRKKLMKVFKNKKSKIEKKEDIEILRFLENNICVKMVKLSGESKAVDTRKDVIEVKEIISKENF